MPLTLGEASKTTVQPSVWAVNGVFCQAVVLTVQGRCTSMVTAAMLDARTPLSTRNLKTSGPT